MNPQLPEAPPLVPLAQPTPQERPSDELGSNGLGALSNCRYCWGQHPGACPFIRSIEWHPSGQIARVILKDRPDHESAVVYAEDEEPT